MANNVDPDQMLKNVASDLGLHCLHMLEVIMVYDSLISLQSDKALLCLLAETLFNIVYINLHERL